jgi:hypothetical protein
MAELQTDFTSCPVEMTYDKLVSMVYEPTGAPTPSGFANHPVRKRRPDRGHGMPWAWRGVSTTMVGEISTCRMVRSHQQPPGEAEMKPSKRRPMPRRGAVARPSRRVALVHHGVHGL